LGLFSRVKKGHFLVLTTEATVSDRRKTGKSAIQGVEKAVFTPYFCEKAVIFRKNR
jgi:hypothetical protein